MHDIFVAHVVLERPGIMPIIGQLIAGGVPEHVRMNWEWELCRLPGPCDRFQEPCGRGGTTRARQFSAGLKIEALAATIGRNTQWIGLSGSGELGDCIRGGETGGCRATSGFGFGRGTAIGPADASWGLDFRSLISIRRLSGMSPGIP